MNLKKFKNRTELEQQAVAFCLDNIESSLTERNHCSILLSGGSTPGPIYSKLSDTNLQWDKVTAGLVDERYLPSEHEQSNEKLIRNTLIRSKAAFINFKGMVKVNNNKKMNLSAVEVAYAGFDNRIDLTVLGMGLDGHTASIFPEDNCSSKALNNNDAYIYYTKAPAYPVNRITCSKELLCKSGQILLLITGQEKLDVLKSNKNLPIHKFIMTRPDINIYWCE
ncbi:MAG: 6-phosphogluconolactonase [Flavobacteriales bacterium]|nr:6-phosphogluconolactonase [Flavobacteriales bacterium]